MITPGTKLARYEIRAKIGEGGMGEVYLARDTQLDRAVALKILSAEVARDQQRLSRFLQEARAGSKLKSANVAHIYEIGEVEGHHFIAMEYVEGEPLNNKMAGSPEGGTPVKSFDLPPGTLSNPHWTTDGRTIIYVITRAEASSLWSQSLDGGAPKQLADFSPEQIFSLGLSRDGKWLAFARGTIIRDVILITDTSKQ